MQGTLLPNAFIQSQILNIISQAPPFLVSFPQGYNVILVDKADAGEISNGTSYPIYRLYKICCKLIFWNS